METLPFMTSQEVKEGDFCCFLLIREVKKFCPVSRGAEKLHLVDGGVAKFWKGIWDWQYAAVFFGKSHVPKLIYIQLFNRSWHTGS